MSGAEQSAAYVRENSFDLLRGWQKAAYEEYFRVARRDFLLVATPGAGKTTYALTVAARLLALREVAAVTVVTPTEHLKYQWAQAATAFGIAIDPSYRNAQGRAGADFQGVAVTYAQVAAHPALHRQRTESRRTLVIFDEVHHAGDALSWGDAIREAFEPARRRLALTGTPFRSDANPIPFVSYVPEADGVKRSASDFVYGYGPALADGVVRPVIFLAYSGEMHWRTRAGDEITATLGTPMTKDQVTQAWRTALDPAGEWIQRVLEAADRRLTEVRRAMPDAAGLVIAGDHETARAYAALLRRVSGVRPVVVLSDDPTASRKISAFASSTDRWMVAVRMVSEGVDVPRLAVGVYATSVSTALFFAQAIGRFVRVRRRGETASVFLPSVPVLLGFAAELEAERDHVVRALSRDPEAELAEAERSRDTPDFEVLGKSFEALAASATFDRVLYDGGEFGTATEAGSLEEEDYLGLPGLLDPDQVAVLLRKRQSRQLTARSAAAAAPLGPGSRPRSRGFGSRPLGPGPAGSVGTGRYREPRGAGRAAQGAQRPGRCLEPPDGTAARGDPRRAAAGVRRPGDPAGVRGADPRPDRDDQEMGPVPALILALLRRHWFKVRTRAGGPRRTDALTRDRGCSTRRSEVMSADASAARTLREEPPAAPAATPGPLTGDPAALGLPCFVAGSVSLGLALVGVVPATAIGAALPIILTATSIGLFLATIWSASLGQTAVASVFGIFGGFWLSYAVLVIGLTHNWFGVAPASAQAAQELFLVAWLVVMVMLTLAMLRLPLAFTAVFFLVDIALLLVFLGVNQTSTGLLKAAGYVVLVFAAIGVYLYFNTATIATGGRAVPLGRPVLHD